MAGVFIVVSKVDLKKTKKRKKEEREEQERETNDKERKIKFVAIDQNIMSIKNILTQLVLAVPHA